MSDDSSRDKNSCALASVAVSDAHQPWRSGATLTLTSVFCAAAIFPESEVDRTLDLASVSYCRWELITFRRVPAGAQPFPAGTTKGSAPMRVPGLRAWGALGYGPFFAASPFSV